MIKGDVCILHISFFVIEKLYYNAKNKNYIINMLKIVNQCGKIP